MTASIYWFCLSTCIYIDPATNLAGSCEYVDGAAAAAIVGLVPSGSRETHDITDNVSKEVPETIGCSEILAVIVIGEEIQDGDDGSNDGSGVGGMTSSLS